MKAFSFTRKPSAPTHLKLTPGLVARLLLVSVACLATGGCASNSRVAVADSPESALTPVYYQSNDNPYHAD